MSTSLPMVTVRSDGSWKRAAGSAIPADTSTRAGVKASEAVGSPINPVAIF